MPGRLRKTFRGRLASRSRQGRLIFRKILHASESRHQEEVFV